MDWDGNNSSLRNLVSLTDHSSIGFLYDFNNNITSFDHHFPSNSAGALLMGESHSHHDARVGILASYGSNNYLQQLHSNINDQKKKKLRGDQLELLERSFQEEIKLDPDRKLRLSRELGLQPRQIAVWFQNRRARWKTKQLERLYDVLKMEFDAVSREKLKLQEEVLRLKAIVRDALPETEKQASAAASACRSNEVLRCATATDLVMNPKEASQQHHHQLESESGDQLVDVHEGYGAAAAMNAYWGGGLPSYP